jgi:hypothetical protein
MAFWLLKTEPSTYSWNDLVKAKRAVWDGVKNPTALRNLREMKVGDQAFIYHTGDEKSIIGIAKVVKAAYPDPKAGDESLVVVDLEPVKPLKNPVTLASIKARQAICAVGPGEDTTPLRDAGESGALEGVVRQLAGSRQLAATSFQGCQSLKSRRPSSPPATSPAPSPS